MLIKFNNLSFLKGRYQTSISLIHVDLSKSDTNTPQNDLHYPVERIRMLVNVLRGFINKNRMLVKINNNNVRILLLSIL